jgi:hypothetical protein
MSKQTAVEWLISQIELGLSDKGMKSAFQQAQKIERLQIIDACHEGVDYENSLYKDPEDYYNQTYGGNDGKN